MYYNNYLKKLGRKQKLKLIKKLLIKLNKYIFIIIKIINYM